MFPKYAYFLILLSRKVVAQLGGNPLPFPLVPYWKKHTLFFSWPLQLSPRVFLLFTINNQA